VTARAIAVMIELPALANVAVEQHMASPAQGPVVQLKDGAVRGTATSGVFAFLGIPYAAAPFGANRMTPPQPAAPWDGERDATSYGPTAPKGEYPPQYAVLFPEVVIPGEDCLNLNVWTPDPGATGLPVLVWIHGGSFMNGSGSVGEYDGSAFARDGVVCVTINYRLAAEGFLFFDDGIANLGLLDQLVALRWVQDNIARFGGDPARVTVAGESAGGMSVTSLLSMPLAQGLFGQAITQSGAAAHTLTREEALRVSGFLADALGVPADRESIKAVQLERLVQTASDLVVEVQTTPDPVKWGRLVLNLLPFAPVVDGATLPQEPLAAIGAGQGAGVSLLTGSNRDEARLFLVPAGTIDLIDDAMLDATAGAYGLPAESLAVYRTGRPGASPGDLLAAVITDWFFGIPAIRVAEARADRGTANTWAYRFDRPDPGENNRLGACHGVELPFVFGTIGHGNLRPRIGDTPSRAVSDQAHRVWVDFITRGDPGWPAYDAGRRATGLISDSITVADDPAGAERASWDRIR
jgi:para-nitrobenzyl esterase